MSEKIFTEPENTTEQWADVRMTDPEEGEWDVDLVVVDGLVRYVDLRVQPDLLPAFVDCLMKDVSDEQASAILTDVAERKQIDLESETTTETEME